MRPPGQRGAQPPPTRLPPCQQFFKLLPIFSSIPRAADTEAVVLFGEFLVNILCREGRGLPLPAAAGTSQANYWERQAQSCEEPGCPLTQARPAACLPVQASLWPCPLTLGGVKPQTSGPA